MAAELRFTTTSDGAAARRDLRQTRSEVSGFGKDTRTAGAEAQRSSRRVSRLGGVAGLAARSFGPLAAAAGAGAVLKFGVDSLKAASDTQQAFGAVDSVFGRNARTVKAWANSAAASVGLARSEYASMAAVLGSTLKNTGIEDFSGKTRELISLGSDLAATYGGSTSQAVTALGAVLRGEYDSIEKYGVSLSESAINSQLAAMGLDNLSGKALVGAKQQARLALITQQTSRVQGQFARESNTLAGAQQRLNARWTNVKDTLGKKLLPIGTRVVSWLLRTLEGSNRTASVLRSFGAIVRSYVTPVIAGFRQGLSSVTSALRSSSGKGDQFGKTVQRVGRFAKAAAPILGRILGLAYSQLGRNIGTAIRVTNSFLNTLAAIGRTARSTASAIGTLIGKINSIPSVGGLSKAVGLFRSADGGLTRASGASPYLSRSAAFSPTLNLVTQPTVVVQIGNRQLRGLVVSVLNDELRERDRKDDGGYWE